VDTLLEIKTMLNGTPSSKQEGNDKIVDKLKTLLESKDRALLIYEAIPEAILNRVPSDLKVLFAKVLDKPDGIFLKEEVEELIMRAARGARKLALKDAQRFLQKEKAQLRRY
jgi:hypothetical protein